MDTNGNYQESRVYGAESEWQAKLGEATHRDGDTGNPNHPSHEWPSLSIGTTMVTWGCPIFRTHIYIWYIYRDIFYIHLIL